jgi:putative endonuclease
MPYMYILLCRDKTYYTGSTIDLEHRLWQHQQGEGANYTRTRLPVELVYCEEYDRIADAFAREKQVQAWSHKKKRALIDGKFEDLPALAKKDFSKRVIRK